MEQRAWSREFGKGRLGDMGTGRPRERNSFYVETGKH